MYGITNEANYTPENFFAGSFPIAKDFGAVSSGATIHRHAPVVMGSGGIAEADEDTLDDLIGIAADNSSDGGVVYYLTGEYFSESLHLPDGVTVDAIKPIFRNMGIFLKEMNSNG